MKLTAKHAPHFNEHIISLFEIFKQGYRAVVDDEDEFEGLTLTERLTGEIVLRSPVENGMYPVLKPQELLPSAMQLHSTNFHMSGTSYSSMLEKNALSPLQLPTS